MIRDYVGGLLKELLSNDLYSMTLVTFEYRLFAYQVEFVQRKQRPDLLHLFLPCTRQLIAQQQKYYATLYLLQCNELEADLPHHIEWFHD